MKILQVNNYHYLRGGAESCYFGTSRLLASHGHEVLHFSVQDERNELSDCSGWFADPVSSEMGQDIIRKIGAASRMLYSFGNNRRIKALMSKRGPVQLAHAHNIHGRVCPSVLRVLKAGRIPVVLTLHDYKLCCPVYTLYSNGRVCSGCAAPHGLKILTDRCTRGSLLQSSLHLVESALHRMLNIYKGNVGMFICPSLFSLNRHAGAGISEKKLVHIPNFINIPEYEPSWESDGYALYAGRLSKEKGVMTLLRAMKGLDVRLKVAGDGPMRGECEAFVRDNRLENVSFEGHRAGDELKALFRNCAFMVMPSEWYENAPMSVIEAFAYGKPVIGSSIGGIPEMVEDGKTGRLFVPGDHVGLAEKIRELAASRPLQLELGRTARKAAEGRYSDGAHYGRLMDAYETAMRVS